MKPCAASWLRALSAAAGSPPWQSTQAKPRSRWTSGAEKSAAGFDNLASLSVAWHVRQAFDAAVCADPGRGDIRIARPDTVVATPSARRNLEPVNMTSYFA